MEFIQKHIQFHCMLARHLELQGFFDFEVWPYCRDVGRSKNLGGGGVLIDGQNLIPHRLRRARTSIKKSVR